ncbi:MAG: archaetidylserine decarboxylase [Candidatus Aminicenantes bacterium]|nr:archaetidylserine decarboxylase [Candidatus Aminicenantes bacterium]
MKKLTPLFLSLLSLPGFSRVWGRITRLRQPRFLVKRVIGWYRRKYGVDMTEYEGEVEDYPCLVDFFTRKLDPEKRPLAADESVVVSPADGILSGMETIFADRAAQIKGKYYPISSLLKEDIDFSEGWHVATVYLSPANYHRCHYPLSGNINRYFHTGGRLFPVNRLGLNHIDELFVRNERIITEIVKNGMSCYVVAVGAMFVGSIRMEFIPGQKKKVRDRWEPVNLDIRQLEEMGRFEMGSTIVLVLPRKMAEPVENVKGKPVRVGQAIFKML